MRHWILLIGLLALSLGASATPFEHGPYTGAPSSDSITISWAGEGWRTRVEYATEKSYQSSDLFDLNVDLLDVQGDETNHLTLEGLLPATDYVYQLVAQSGSQTVTSPIGHFQTEPTPGSPISFLVLADTQWQWEGENRLEAVSRAIVSSLEEANRSPAADLDFILHAGDIVESPTSTYWNHWFGAFDDLLLAAPFIPVLGNHEKNNSSYYKAFTLPPGAGTRDERWWALHWGDVVVVGLDTNAGRADRIRAQQAWAEEHLSGPEPHKFVIFHHPVFSSDAFHGGGYSYDLIYHPIFVETGVDIVFNGHAHNYERILRDGVTYLVVGGGGAVPRALAEEHVAGSIVAVEGHNFFTRVTASPESIEVIVPAVAVAGEDAFEPVSGVILDRFNLTEDEPDSVTAHVNWPTILGLATVAAVALWALLRGIR